MLQWLQRKAFRGIFFELIKSNVIKIKTRIWVYLHISNSNSGKKKYIELKSKTSQSKGHKDNVLTSLKS